MCSIQRKRHRSPTGWCFVPSRKMWNKTKGEEVSHSYHFGQWLKCIFSLETFEKSHWSLHILRFYDGLRIGSNLYGRFLHFFTFLDFLTSIHQNLCRGAPWRHHAASRPHRLRSLRVHIGWLRDDDLRALPRSQNRSASLGSKFQDQAIFHHFSFGLIPIIASFQAARLPPIPPNSRPTGRSLSKHRAQISPIKRCNFLSNSHEAPCPWQPAS